METRENKLIQSFASYKQGEETSKLSSNFVIIEKATWKYGQIYFLGIVRRNSNY
jgi:hypothetical protein